MAWSEEKWREHGYSRMQVRLRERQHQEFLEYARATGQTQTAAVEEILEAGLQTLRERRGLRG
jgi:hypothetical protein